MKTSWSTKNLGEVCDFRVVKNTKFFPYVGMEDVESNTGKFIGGRESRRVKSSTAHFDETCVLYGKLRPYLNKVFVPDFEGHSSTEFIPLKPNEKFLTREWLAKWLMSPSVIKEISENVAGARMPRANLGHLKNLEIPLPPIAEQKKIVARVEKLLAKVKEAKRLRAEARAAAESLLSAELHKIFGEGKKKGWDVCNIGDKNVMSMTSGGTPSRSHKSYYQGSIAWLKSGELGDNINILDSEEHITEDAIKKSSAKVFPKNTVLLAMYGATAGKLGILGNPSATNQAIAGMTCNEDRLHYKYLFYVLVDIRNRIVMQAWGGAQPNLSQTIIKKFQIPLPLLAEQKKIVARLDALSAKLKKLEEYQKSADLDLARLEQSILHQAFQGE